jgi:hypothetical protein
MKPRYFMHYWTKLKWPIYSTIRKHFGSPVKIGDWEEHNLGHWQKPAEATSLGPRLIIGVRTILIRDVDEHIAAFDGQTTPDKLKEFFLNTCKNKPNFLGVNTVMDMIFYYNPDADMDSPHLKMADVCVDCDNTDCGGILPREQPGEECPDWVKEEYKTEAKPDADQKMEKT